METCRAPAQADVSGFFGVVEAIVAENTGDPAKEGRVKVRFPWFDGDVVTDWCRVAQPYAGNGYGAFWIPEKGDEVLVGFVHGDMRFPIVLGGLYNGVDKPSTSRETSRDQKLFRTKAGHELLLDDTSGSQRVRITTAGGHRVDLDDQGSAITLQTSGGQKLTLDGNSGTITVEATNVSVKATSVQVQATTIELGQPATEPVLLGATFAALFDAHVHTLVPGGTSPPVTPTPPTALSLQVITG